MMTQEKKDLQKIHDDFLYQAKELNKIFQNPEYSAMLNEVIKAHQKEKDSGNLGHTSMAFFLGQSVVLAQIGSALISFMKKYEGD